MFKALRTRAASDEGFTLVEVMVALTILAMLSVAFGLTMNATVRTYHTSRNKTLAEQLATEQTEDARRIAYDDLGVVGGSPPGTMPATKTEVRDDRTFTVTTEVDYVNDPIPPPDGFESYANYKRVHVTVSLAGTTNVLADLSTLVAPPLRPSKDKAVVKVQVLDYGNNLAVEDASVQLTGGPSPHQTKWTNSGGNAVFAQIQPNATSGSTNLYYDVNVTHPGYEVLPENRVPAAIARPVLEAREIFTSTINIYRPMHFALSVVNPRGEPYGGAATVAVSAPSRSTSDTIPVTGGAGEVTGLGGESIIPSVNYEFVATTPEGESAAVTTRSGQTGYPTVLSDAVTLQVPYQKATLDVVVTDEMNGDRVPGVTVELKDGPLPITSARTATTDANGVARFTGTSGAEVSGCCPFTITIPAQSGFLVATTTTTVSTVSPTPVPVTVQRGTTQLHVTVVDDLTSEPVPNAAVQLTDGPYAETLPGTTDAAGKAEFTVYPGGAAYTVRVPAAGEYKELTQSVPVPGPAATDVTLRLQHERTPLDIVVTDQRNGAKVVGATVQLTGGPANLTTPRTAETDSNGVARFDDTDVSPSKPYTITIPAYGGFVATTAAMTVATVNPAPVPVTMPRGTTQLNVTLIDDRTSQPVATTGVQVTDGPYAETLPGTTDATGKASFGVSTGGASYTVTVPATAGYSQVAQTVAVPGPGAANVTIRLVRPKVDLQVTVRDALTNLPITDAWVEVTGGPYSETTTTLPRQRTGTTSPNVGKATFSVHVSPSVPYSVTVPAHLLYRVNVTTVLVPGPGSTTHSVGLSIL